MLFSEFSDVLFEQIPSDGVVEYCYELRGYRIYGSDDYWNISRATFNHLAHHSLALITSKTQAQDNMTLVRSTEPVSP